jgi:hypothetical protein
MSALRLLTPADARSRIGLEGCNFSADTEPTQNGFPETCHSSSNSFGISPIKREGRW